MPDAASHESSSPSNLPPQTSASGPTARSVNLEALLVQMEATASTSGSSFQMSSSLAAVADLHRNQPFSLNPILIDLVTAALTEWFGGNDAAHRTAWRSLAATVARTMFDDPVAHDRLLRIWRMLQERGAT